MTTETNSSETFQQDDRVYLKAKVASLAAEARIIRKLEARQAERMRRAYQAERFVEQAEAHRVRKGLSAHRRGVVRSEARAAQLAMAFIRGKRYRSVEAWTHEAPRWDRVEQLVRKYAPRLAVRVENTNQWVVPMLSDWAKEPEVARPDAAERGYGWLDGVVLFEAGETILRAERAYGRFVAMGEIDGMYFVQFGYEGGVVPEGAPVPVGGGGYGIESRKAAAEQFDAVAADWLTRGDASTLGVSG